MTSTAFDPIEAAFGEEATPEPTRRIIPSAPARGTDGIRLSDEQYNRMKQELFTDIGTALQVQTVGSVVKAVKAEIGDDVIRDVVKEELAKVTPTIEKRARQTAREEVTTRVRRIDSAAGRQLRRLSWGDRSLVLLAAAAVAVLLFWVGMNWNRQNATIFFAVLAGIMMAIGLALLLKGREPLFNSQARKAKKIAKQRARLAKMQQKLGAVPPSTPES